MISRAILSIQPSMEETDYEDEITFARRIRTELGLNPVLQDDATIIRLAAALGRFAPVVDRGPRRSSRTDHRSSAA